MIKTIKKVDFSRVDLEKMQRNDSIMVLHDDFKSAESTMSMARMEIKRNPRTDIERYKSGMEAGTFTVLITAIPKK